MSAELSHRTAWRFLALAVAASWLDWAVIPIAVRSLPHAIVTAMLMAGFLMISLAAVVIVARRGGRAGVQVLGRSTTDWRRISPAAWAAALLLLPALTFGATAFDSYRTGNAVQAGNLLQAGLQPLVLLRMFGFSVLVGPLLEEIGWRGVALAPLERRYGALAGAIIVGSVHALWHLPLFILPEGYFHGLGLLTPAFWRFLGEILVFDLLAAALFNYTRSSVLAAFAFHCSFNAAGALWILSPVATGYRDGVAALAAIVLIVATRTRLFLDSSDGGTVAAGRRI